MRELLAAPLKVAVIALAMLCSQLFVNAKPALAAGDGSPYLAVEDAVFQCPYQSPYYGSYWVVYPTLAVPFVLPGYACMWLVETFTSHVDRTEAIIKAPVWMALDDALDIVLAGEQPDTAIEPVATGAAVMVSEQVHTLAELIAWQVQTYLLNEQTHTFEVKIDTARQVILLHQRVDVWHCTIDLDCLAGLPSSLPSAIGCPGCAGPVKVTVGQPYANPLAAVPNSPCVQCHGAAATSEPETGGNFREWGAWYLSGRNRNKLKGYAGFLSYINHLRVHRTLDFFAVRQQVSMTPGDGCLVKLSQAETDPRKTGGMQLAGWEPGQTEFVDVDRLEDLTAAIKRGMPGGWEAGLSITDSTTYFKGIAGGETTSKDGHRVLWKANNLGGIKLTRGIKGLSTWSRPRSSGSTWWSTMEGYARC